MRRFIITGAPGAGKTAIIRQLPGTKHRQSFNKPIQIVEPVKSRVG